jgi:anaerobic magnesium-protoporphyrin IX monomethyl ester cyclase
MAKVLLINPSYQQQYGGNKTSVINPIYPTLGLATIAATAEINGHAVEILDLSWRDYDYDLIKNRIERFGADIVGVTATTTLMNQARDISVLTKDIAKAAHRDIITVVGGPHPASMPEATIRESLFDVVFTDEADESFPELCNSLDPSRVSGLYYRDGSKVVSTGRRAPILDLDSLPMPAWHFYDPDDYHHISRLLAKKTPVTIVEFSRGCVFKCDFCASKQTMGLGYRKKSPERCAQEVEQMYRLGFREFMVADDIFSSDQKWATEVSEQITSLDIPMPWTCTNGIRIESANKVLFETMRKAGCYRVAFGFESGNNNILKRFGKGGQASIEKGQEAVAAARDAGIDTLGFFMFGLSGDTEETMLDTINYAKNLPVDTMKFGVCIAFPGTPMFADYSKKGWIKSYNWDEYFVYTDQALFVHENLDYKTVQRYMKTAWRRAMFFNPRFIGRRVIRGFRGIKDFELFWDIFYFFKAVMLPSVGKVFSTNYYAEDRWPKYDFEASEYVQLQYQVVRKLSRHEATVARGKHSAKTPSSQIGDRVA